MPINVLHGITDFESWKFKNYNNVNIKEIMNVSLHLFKELFAKKFASLSYFQNCNKELSIGIYLEVISHG